MPIYVFRILGENFHATIDDKQATYGFFTYRVAEADDATTAENHAMQMLRDDEGLRELVQNPADDPPTMRIDDTYEIERHEDFEDAEGFIWFEMKPKRWWQFWRR
jgi:hypothetical protein